MIFAFQIGRLAASARLHIKYVCIWVYILKPEKLCACFHFELPLDCPNFAISPASTSDLQYLATRELALESGFGGVLKRQPCILGMGLVLI